MKMKKGIAILIATALFALSSSYALAGITITGDVTKGFGVFTITEDIVFNLVDGTAPNPNADPYAILFHDWMIDKGAWWDGYTGIGGRHQLDGDLLALSRDPTPFDTTSNDIFVVDGGARSNVLTSAPLFDGNFYNRGSVLFFSNTYQQVRQLGPTALGHGDRLVIGAGSWKMPTIEGWDLRGEFSGDVTIYRALGLNPQASGAIPVATTNLAAVPEPTSLAIFGIGALCFGGAGAARRRRKEKQAAAA
ncbi:MAG: hypothetical protein COA78_13510 [Blastopirellula sp.]|nr:MAG: hypothetical protein COA78_13510 [Blastopirellula sp.]